MKSIRKTLLSSAAALLLLTLFGTQPAKACDVIQISSPLEYCYGGTFNPYIYDYDCCMGSGTLEVLIVGGYVPGPTLYFTDVYASSAPVSSIDDQYVPLNPEDVELDCGDLPITVWVIARTKSPAGVVTCWSAKQITMVCCDN